MPKISVIIPNYNHARYLMTRIESVLNQTFQDFEVIILDDLSTDNSREIIESYRNHPKISQLIFNAENSGSTFLQWDKGIQIAKGEWIWIAESDDWCEITLLENLVRGIENNPNIGLAYVQSIFFYEQTGYFVPAISEIKDEEIIEKGFLVSKKLLPYNSLLNAGMAIFKKELFYKVNPVYKEYKLAGDWVFWAEISQNCDTFVCGKALNYFRMHPVKVTFNTKKTGLGAVEELKVLNYFKEKKYITSDDFDKTVFKLYFAFRYQNFDYDEGVIEKTNLLFMQNFSKAVSRKMQKKILKDKLTTKVNKLIEIFFR